MCPMTSCIQFRSNFSWKYKLILADSREVSLISIFAWRVFLLLLHYKYFSNEKTYWGYSHLYYLIYHSISTMIHNLLSLPEIDLSLSSFTESIGLSKSRTSCTSLSCFPHLFNSPLSGILMQIRVVSVFVIYYRERA